MSSLEAVNLGTCFALDGDIDNTIEYWRTHACPQALEAQLNNTSIGGEAKFIYNEESLTTAQGYMGSLINSFLDKYSFVQDTQDPGYSAFQENIISTCRMESLPGVCSNYLEQYCPRYTRSEISENSAIGALCGCFAENNPYANAGVGSECDPLCAKSTSVKRANRETGELIRCSPNVCIIDENGINAYNSVSTGGVNFTNVCTGCSGDGCVCIISGVDPDGIMSELGVSPTINQFCGKESVCITTDSEGNMISSKNCQQKTIDSVTSSWYRRAFGIYWVPIFLAFAFAAVTLFSLFMWLLLGYKCL